MNKKTIMMGALGLVVLSAAAIATGTYAYQGDPAKVGPNYTPERHAIMEDAFESNNYVAWKGQMGDRGATRKVNEQNFARFAEMHELMEDGKTDEANAIRAELGLGQGNGNGQGKGTHSGQCGQNKNGNFVDANGDGNCDNMQ
ncbi:MAG: hypothetical protein COX30_00900 [Candidatus Moranbacteria bacterium CG23_combo_of_CG06-09_8_20_14_all_39_10]|nr:MAG: hypothetical protein COX30_00900 [Candidatus Moranbacteria bacterium CG23_combo_of_CG06-09_8_20_14_all_39_10]